MSTIDALTRFVTALGAATAIWTFAATLVDVLARSRAVGEPEDDTPTQSDDPQVPPTHAVGT